MKFKNKNHFKKWQLTLVMCLYSCFIWAQSSAGITQATTEVRSYITPISNLIIAVGAVVGLIGGVRVYIKWQSGDQDTQKAIMGWFGACLFLILVGVVVGAFFG